ncbi:hypothetical protein CU048_14325 [Beijerinckiaceae bacterium]|nr:hypothetical protein CU048_14325 [Beijerinckiaceae bacterium]
MTYSRHASGVDRCKLVLPLISFGLAGVLSMALPLAADARSLHAYLPPSVDENPWQEYYQRPPPPCTSLDDCDRKAYGESGTRGRMGLGADPAHPEGPGNVSD